MLKTMSAVRECTATACGYNHEGCHAFAITIDGSADCGTFVPLFTKGGVDEAVAQVGACVRTDCKYNSGLECTADGVSVGMAEKDVARCLTYAKV